MDEVLIFGSETRIEGNTLFGLAHKYGTRAKVNGRYEVMQKGVFDEALKTSDVRAFYQHDKTKILGRQSAGTLRLDASGEGLAYEIDLPNTQVGQEVKELFARGDLKEMSFGFIPGDVELTRAENGIQIRTHTKAKELIDISPVTFPAFEGTSVSMRNKSFENESLESQLIRARHRVLKGDKELNG